MGKLSREKMRSGVLSRPVSTIGIEDTKVIHQSVKLKPDLIVTEPLAGQAGPDDGVLASLDVVFGSAALIVEADDPFRLHQQVGDDKTHAREQITGMPFDLGNHPSVFEP